MAKDELHMTRNEFVYFTLRRNLLNGTFVLGERLRLPALCTEYGVSITVLREGLVRLTEQGLIKFEANKGYWVPSYTAEDIEDLAYVRTNIECLALRASIEKGDIEWSARVVAAHHRLQMTPRASLIDDPAGNEKWSEVHRLFHEALTSACGSPRLATFRRQLFDEAEMMRQLAGTLSRERRDVEGEHSAITEAAIRRDADAACELMVSHLHVTATFAVSALPGREVAPSTGPDTGSRRRTRRASNAVSE